MERGAILNRVANKLRTATEKPNARLIIIVIALIGSTVLVAAQSAANFKFEAESGTLSGQVATGSDEAASAGSFLQFNSISTSQWAFEENWDSFGAPTAPLPYNNPEKFNIVISSNDRDGVVDGQVAVGESGTSFPPIEAGHGHDCSAPLNNGANNIHKITNNFDELGHQTHIRPQLVFVCNQHLMTVQKSGYSLASIMPRQYFDFAGRTGLIEIDTNLYGFGREWFDMYVMPEEDVLQSMATSSEGGTLEQMPRTAAKISFRDAKPSMYFIENYSNNDTATRFFRVGQQFKDMFPNDPAPNDPRIRRKFRFHVSQTSWKYQIQMDGTAPVSPPEGTFETIDGVKYWTLTGNFPKPLPFTLAAIVLEHHSYNPTKDGIFGEPWSQFTQHWDNFRFDGPVLPMHKAFEPSQPHFVKLFNGPAPGSMSSPIKISVNVPQAQIRNAKLVGEVAAMMTADDVDYKNTSHWMQFRINGGSWQDITLVKDVECGCDRTWSTFRNSISNVVSGENTIEFKYAAKPPQATWQWPGFNAKDIEIRTDP